MWRKVLMTTVAPRPLMWWHSPMAARGFAKVVSLAAFRLGIVDH